LFRFGAVTKKKIIEDDESHAALLQLSKKDNKKTEVFHLTNLFWITLLLKTDKRGYGERLRVSKQELEL